MQTWLIIVIAVGVVLVFLIGHTIVMQRKFVNLDELCKNALGQIEVQLNSRWDGLMALAQSAARYSKHEAETMMQVIQARRNTVVNTAADVVAQQHDMQSVANRLMAVGEAYPDLKAADLYARTMDGVQKYEEQVRMARMIYNDTATRMNRVVRQFPSSIFAALLGYGKREYLKADGIQKTAYPDFNEAFRV